MPLFVISFGMEKKFSIYIAILPKIGEIGGPVTSIIDVEGIYRSRAWWTNVEKGEKKAIKLQGRRERR